MTKIRGSDIEVTKDDQTNINSFSKYYLKKQEIEGLIKVQNDLKTQNDDALTELELSNDDEIVGTRFGACFINISAEHAKEFIQQDQKKINQTLADLKNSMEDTVKRMKKLKATLYGKFGNSINLEE